MSASLRFSLAALGLLVLATPVAAQRRPVVVRGPKGNLHVVHPRVRHVFRDGDRLIFRNYYRVHRIVLTPLRPELRALVIVGKPLPVGVLRVALARELLTQVPPPEPGYEYVIVGDRVVMIDDEGNVADILDAIFP